jgi:hypothetical protein
MKKYYTSVWFWWIFFTVVYVLLSFAGGYSLNGTAGHFFAIIGLFVPIGFLTFIYLFNIQGLIAVAALIIIFTAEHRFLRKFIPKDGQKILLALATLLIATLICDLIVFGSWTSLKIVFNGI